LGDDGAIRFCETLIKDFGLMLLPSSVYQSELTQLSNDYFRIGYGRIKMKDGLEVLKQAIKKL
jgi:hypothetical protein